MIIDEWVVEIYLHLCVVECQGERGVTDTTTGTQTRVRHLHKALKHRVAEVLIWHVFKFVHVQIDIRILEVEEADGCIYENDSEEEECSHQELASVERD